MNHHIPLWHECKHGNNFGCWSDEPMSCRVCHETPELPKPKRIYDAYTMPPTLVNKDTYPMVTDAWTPGATRGRE